MGNRNVEKPRRPMASPAPAAELPAVAFAAISVGACVIDRRMRLHLFNGRFFATLNLANRDAAELGAPVPAILDAAVRRGAVTISAANQLRSAMKKGFSRARPSETRIQLAHDQTVCLRHTSIGGGKWLVTVEDVSASRRLEDELQLQVRCLNHALANMSQGLCLFGPDERLIMRNEQYCTIYDIDPDFVRPGIRHRQIIEHWVARGNQPGMSAEQLYEKRMREIRSENVRVGRLIRRDGRIIEAISRITPEGGWVSTNEDITERCQAEARISHMARHDPLTNLPNRILFRESMSESMLRVAQGTHAVSLLLVDLDEFKATNDRFGHAVGDTLLETVAARLSRSIRSGDTAARLGGDEFAVIAQTASADAVAKLAGRILNHVCRPAAVGGHLIEPSLSIGIARAPEDGATEAALMQCADVALYRSKKAGRKTYRFFDADVDRCMHEKYKPAHDARTAAKAVEPRSSLQSCEHPVAEAVSDLMPDVLAARRLLPN